MSHGIVFDMMCTRKVETNFVLEDFHDIIHYQENACTAKRR